MSRIRVQHKQIEIERNVIEKFLISIKDFIKKYRRPVLFSAIGVVASFIVIIAVSLIQGKIKNDERLQYDQLMSRYYRDIARGDDAKVRRTIGEFAEFVDSAHLDYIENTGPYILGNMYYTQGMYKEAKQSLMQYVNDSPETELTSLAIIKAAVASEELNDLEGAYKLLKKAEAGYKETLAGEQIYYQLARYYLIKNDPDKARKYLEREISSYPTSPYAHLARKRLMLMETAK